MTMVSGIQTADGHDMPLPAPLFKTKRLLVRPMHPQDAESSQRACAPPSITRYMSLAFAHPYTIDHANAWIAMNKENPYSTFFLLPATITAR